MNAMTSKEVKGIYQRWKNNKYILPTAVYNKTIWQIRDYYRLKEAQDDIIYQQGAPDGTPRASTVGDPTYNKALKLEHVRNIVGVIEVALQEIPQEYRRGVWDSVQYRSPYPIDADRSTYGRLKSKFVYTVARRLDYIGDEQ